MKKILVVVLVVALAMIGASAAMAAVVGTKHDMTTIATGTGVGGAFSVGAGEVCVYCHTPHGANTTAGMTLLWNRTFGTDGATYTPYTSTTSTVANASSMSSITKVCLSCHDGTVAVFSMGNAPNYGGSVAAMTGPSGKLLGTGMMTGDALLTNDMSNDHPISFDYATAVSYNDAAAYQATLPATLPLVGGMMECSTCHDVHGGQPTSAFLRIDNDRSALCTTCHINK
jgi:predicted CXXCH cytochrome family protein